MFNQTKLMNEIRAEREYQMEKWGDDFDRKNTINDWTAYIIKYLGFAIIAPSKVTFREKMVKVITLAMAAIEWSERGMAPTHDEMND